MAVAGSWRTELSPVACAGATIGGAWAGTGVAPAGAARVCAAVVVVGVLLACTGLRVAQVAAVALCCLGLALCCAARAHHGVVQHGLVPLLRNPRPLVVHGVLANDPNPGRFDTTALVRVDRFRIGSHLAAGDRWRGLHRTVLLRATATSASELAALDAGDTVTVEGDPRPLTGFDARTIWQHAVARVDVVAIIDAAPAGRATSRSRTRCAV